MERLTRYVTLQQIMCNSSLRYYSGSNKRGEVFSLRVMDKGMENVNMWTKGLLLRPDKDYWKNHSPNVIAAKQCSVFEEEQYVCHLNNKEKYRDSMSHGT